MNCGRHLNHKITRLLSEKHLVIPAVIRKIFQKFPSGAGDIKLPESAQEKPIHSNWVKFATLNLIDEL